MTTIEIRGETATWSGDGFVLITDSDGDQVKVTTELIEAIYRLT